MKERPILFSAPMVRALLDGSKKQTRRVVKPQPYRDDYMADGDVRRQFAMLSPYGQPGDRLWVRETHRAVWGQSPGYLIGVDYKADPQEKWERMRDHGGRPNWTPSIHMRREYSRILLEVVSVRLERLNECSEADARAEGVIIEDRHAGGYCADESLPPAVRAYRELWNEINGTGAWQANPWVWVIDLKRVTP